MGDDSNEDTHQSGTEVYYDNRLYDTDKQDLSNLANESAYYSDSTILPPTNTTQKILDSERAETHRLIEKYHSDRDKVVREAEKAQKALTKGATSFEGEDSEELTRLDKRRWQRELLRIHTLTPLSDDDRNTWQNEFGDWILELIEDN